MTCATLEIAVYMVRKKNVNQTISNGLIDKIYCFGYLRFPDQSTFTVLVQHNVTPGY